MQGLIRCAVVAGALSGCHADDTVAPDAPAGEARLRVVWSSAPESWPGDINSNVTLDTATLRFANLRVIGDAGPGDPRTTATGFEVRWDASEAPEPIAFATAPIGLYSQIALQLDGHDVDESYELRGTVGFGGTQIEYRIEDDGPLPITLTIDEAVGPEGTTTVRVHVDFVYALASLNFSDFDFVGDHLEMTEDNPSITEFRRAFADSFKPEKGDQASETRSSKAE